MEVKNVKSITPKAVLELGRTGKLPIPTKQEQLYIVYGAANGLVHKPTPFDADQYAIAGRFEAIRSADRQQFAGEYVYLPGDAHGRVVQLLQPNKDTGAMIGDAQIAFEIGYGPDADSPTKYKFYCKPILDATTQDLLSQTRNAISGKLQALLPAPTPAKPK